MTEAEIKESKKVDWTKAAVILKNLETKRFYGSVEIKMEDGAPVYARVTEGIKLDGK